jgi:K+-sensing histidine kinase KdpD
LTLTATATATADLDVDVDAGLTPNPTAFFDFTTSPSGWVKTGSSSTLAVAVAVAVADHDAVNVHVNVNVGSVLCWSKLKDVDDRAIPLRLAEIDVEALVTSAVGALQRDANAREVSLTVECAKAGSANALVDPEKIGWAVATLVGNAMRYVRCGTRLHPGGAIAVTIARDPKSRSLVITVKDDGPGIPADKLSTLWERGKGKHAPGLGLHLIKDVIEAHGGTLKVESSTDPDAHGTSVRIALAAP